MLARVGLDRLRAQVQQHLGNVDAHGARVEARAAQRGREGQRRALLDPLEHRRQDRADGPGVDRAIGMASGAAVDGADIEAGAAADAGEGLPSDRIREDARAAVVEQHEVEGLRPVVGANSRPERGVRVHALARRRAGQQLQEDLEVLEARQHLLDAHDGDQDAGKGRAHAPVALRLDDRDGAGLGDREVRARDGDLRAQEALAQVHASGLRERGRLVREAGHAERAAEEIADLRAVLVDRGDDDVRGSVPGELHDQLGEIGLERLHACATERLVEPDLVGRHRLDLDDLLDALREHEPGHDLGRLRRVARPVHDTAGARDARLELLEVVVQMPEGAALDRLAGEAQLLPVGQLGDHLPALGADRVGGDAQVLAQLEVAELAARGLGERHDRLAHAGHAAPPAASTSARWSVRTREAFRESTPPMCMRHERSPATSTSAPLASTADALSSPIAAEVSEFLTANVPPKPQHSSARGRSTSSSPRTARSRR